MYAFIKEYLLKKRKMRIYAILAILQTRYFESFDPTLHNRGHQKKTYQWQCRFIKALHQLPLSHFGAFYEILSAIHLIKSRVKDPAWYELCQRELNLLKETSIRVFKDFSKNTIDAESIEKFLNAIHAFENLYTNTLQVVMPDPKVFQFFVQDLYALYSHFEEVK